jgi:hypothetical protein
MQQDIGIGVAGQALVVPDCHAADDQRPPRDQAVYVVSLSDSHALLKLKVNHGGLAPEDIYRGTQKGTEEM